MRVHTDVCINIYIYVCVYVIARGTAQKGLVLEKNALNRLVHNLLELISKG